MRAVGGFLVATKLATVRRRMGSSTSSSSLETLQVRAKQPRRSQDTLHHPQGSQNRCFHPAFPTLEARYKQAQALVGGQAEWVQSLFPPGFSNPGSMLRTGPSLGRRSGRAGARGWSATWTGTVRIPMCTKRAAEGCLNGLTRSSKKTRF